MPWWALAERERRPDEIMQQQATRSANARGEASTEGCRRRAVGGGTTHRTNAGSARQTPHPRVALSRASESVQGAAKASPGGHQDDGYWRSLRASLIAADDLLTLAVARARTSQCGRTRRDERCGGRAGGEFEIRSNACARPRPRAAFGSSRRQRRSGMWTLRKSARR